MHAFIAYYKESNLCFMCCQMHVWYNALTETGVHFLKSECDMKVEWTLCLFSDIDGIYVVMLSRL